MRTKVNFGNEDGRRECAEAVRSQAGLVAVESDRVVGFLTVVHHFPETSEITWMAVHAGAAAGASAGPWSGTSSASCGTRGGGCCWC